MLELIASALYRFHFNSVYPVTANDYRHYRAIYTIENIPYSLHIITWVFPLVLGQHCAPIRITIKGVK